jgi:ribosomal protein S18 acetylase RimI-like enzyme
VRDLGREDLGGALAIVARAMADNPLHVRVLGNDPPTRLRLVQRLQGLLLQSVYARGTILGAEQGGSLAGVLGMARRKPGLAQTGQLALGVLTNFPPKVTALIGAWFVQWIRHVPRTPYWHIGPVAVDPGRQRQGVGSALMRALCAYLDHQDALAYLEVDQPENVRFYAKFGFDVVREAAVLGVPNWFMAREPSPTPTGRRKNAQETQ